MDIMCVNMNRLRKKLKKPCLVSYCTICEREFVLRLRRTSVRWALKRSALRIAQR